ncbi:hypothetical protein [Curtobacterium sp. L1-20]|uniref:hypothetical protein n=1 Tax=Curtobacterium sp. L1-20 TaxID=3138181 RepID=UPI003B524950
MAPSPFRSTAVVCSIITASLGFGLLTPVMASAATPPPASSVAQDPPADSIVGLPVDPRLDAPIVSRIEDTFAGSRAVMGFAGGDDVYLLDGDETVSRWAGGQGLFLLRALDKYRDSALDLVRVHTAADGTKTRTERSALPRTLQVDGLRASNQFLPGTKQFRGTASVGATITATDVTSGTTLFETEVPAARTAVGAWSADAELTAGDHTVTFTQTLPDGRKSVIDRVAFSEGTGEAPAAPVVQPSERRLDGDFTLWGAVDDRTVEVEVRTADGTSIGETRVVDGDFTATIPQEHLGSTVDVVAIAADGTESAVSPAELTPLPVSTAVTKPAVREVNVLPDGTVQVIGEVQQMAGAQILDGDTVVGSIPSGTNGWSYNIRAQFTGKQLDLVNLGFDGQRYSATSERVALPRLLQVDGVAAENSYTPGENDFSGSAEAGATVVARDQKGTELFRAEAKETRSGVAKWSARADLASADGYAVTFTQTTADGRTSVMKDITFTPQEDEAPTAPTAEGYFPEDVAHWAGIAGLATVGSDVVARTSDGTEIGRTTVTDPSGTYNIGIDPAKVGDGVQEFEVTQVVDGSESPSTAAELDYGTNAPAFTAPTDGSTIAGKGLSFAGTGDASGTITLNGTDFTDSRAIGTARVVDGVWQIDNDELDLPSGDYQFWAMQRTKGGKTAFSGVNVRVQSTNLTAEGYFPEDVAQWAGIAGYAERGTDVVVRNTAGTEIGRTTVEGQGGLYNIGIDPAKVGDGEQHLVVTQEHEGVVSPGVDVTLDYGTNAPTFTSPANDGSTKALAFTGTGDQGGRVLLLGVGGGSEPTIGSAVVEDGRWSITNDDLELPSGAYQFWAHQRTKGGKISNTGINIHITAEGTRQGDEQSETLPLVIEHQPGLFFAFDRDDKWGVVQKGGNHASYEAAEAAAATVSMPVVGAEGKVEFADGTCLQAAVPRNFGFILKRTDCDAEMTSWARESNGALRVLDAGDSMPYFGNFDVTTKEGLTSPRDLPISTEG